jgi:sporulation protein YlmC with PRC-barrel domain
VTVRQPPPNVTVEQGASQVVVQQPQPQVTVQQPQVSVEQGQPRVSVQQQEPQINPTSQGVQQQAARPAASERASRSASALQGPAAGTGAQAQGGLRSTQLLGKPIGSGHGTDIGTLRDLIIERNGQVSRAVIGSGGVLGLGSRLVAVPFQALHITPLGHMVYEQASRKPLDQQPELNDEQLNGGQELRSTRLVGARVWDTRGEDLGRIDDLLIGRQDGRVHEIVLSVGGFLGIGDKLVEFPFDALELGGNERVIARTDKKSLEQQPRFSYQKLTQLK